MTYVQSGPVNLYVETSGEGYPIVFVHEFASDHREWEPQVRWFSRSYRCVTYNARGYPPSDVPEEPEQYGWEFAVSDLLAVLDGLDIAVAHLVGLSMGGYAVLQFALHHPDRVSAVVASAAGSGSAPGDRDQWPAVAAAIADGFLTRGMTVMASEIGYSPTRIQLHQKSPRSWHEFMDHLLQHSPLGMANTMKRYQALRPSLYDFREQFAKMTTPVLLALGDEDAPCLETNLMLKQAIPGSGLWICPGTGHAVNLEEPAEFNAMVESFFAGVERRTRG